MVPAALLGAPVGALQAMVLLEQTPDEVGALDEVGGLVVGGGVIK